MNLTTDRMPKHCAGVRERNLSSTALDAHDTTEQLLRVAVVFESRVSTSNHPLRASRGDQSVHSKPVVILRQNNVAAAQVCCFRADDDHRVSLPEIRLHAQSAHLETHLIPGLQQRFAHCPEA